MQYNLQINQYTAYALGLVGMLDAIDLLLFDFVYHLMNNQKTPKTYIDGSEYANIRHSLVLQECPILGLNHRDTFRKRMIKLCNARLLERYDNNQAENSSLYKRGELFSVFVSTMQLTDNLPISVGTPADFNRPNLPISVGTNIIQDKHYTSNQDIYSANDICASDIDKQFEVFWNLYNKKRGREQCRRLWGKMSQRDRLEILEKTPAYIAATPDKQFRKDPQTYLNPKNKHWKDEIINNERQSGNTEHSGNNPRNEGRGYEERRKRDYVPFQF